MDPMEWIDHQPPWLASILRGLILALVTELIFLASASAAGNPPRLEQWVTWAPLLLGVARVGEGLVDQLRKPNQNSPAVLAESKGASPSPQPRSP